MDNEQLLELETVKLHFRDQIQEGTPWLMPSVPSSGPGIRTGRAEQRAVGTSAWNHVAIGLYGTLYVPDLQIFVTQRASLMLTAFSEQKTTDKTFSYSLTIPTPIFSVSSLPPCPVFDFSQWNSGWHWTCWLPVSVLQVVELKTCTTIPGFAVFLSMKRK